MAIILYLPLTIVVSKQQSKQLPACTLVFSTLSVTLYFDSFLAPITMQKNIAFDVNKFSAAEYAAFALLAIASAAGAALVNKYFPLPQAVFLAIWFFAVVLLSFALTRSIRDAWQANNLPAKIFSVFLLISVFLSALKATATGFSRHDEIYSWGMWGVQHALGDSADLYYTGAAYPQLFSYEIGSVFLAQGSHISHFFAKIIVALPVILIFIVLGEFTAKSQRGWINWFTLLLSVTSIAIIANVLHWAYADPLASAMLITSMALILQYAQRRDLRVMVLACASGVMASLTKQPGLVWCLASLPAITVYGVWRLGWKKDVLIPCSAAILLAAIWPIFVAPSFASNQGVMDIVKNNGGIADSVIKSVNSYVFMRPEIGCILILPFFLFFRNISSRFLWLCFVFPYLVIWFAFGSYEARHGMHVILLSVLLVGHALTLIHPVTGNTSIASEKDMLTKRNWLLLLSFFIVISSITLAYSRNGNALRDGNRAIFVSQFGADAVNIFDDIISSQLPVFSTSNYQYGWLFNRTPLYRLDAGIQDLSVQKIKKYLLESGAQYFFDAGDWNFGPISATIQSFIKMCPDALQLVKISELQPQFKIYKVDQVYLMSRCYP